MSSNKSKHNQKAAPRAAIVDKQTGRWFVAVDNPNLGKLQMGSGSNRSMSVGPKTGAAHASQSTHTGPTGGKAAKGDMVSLAPGEQSSKQQNRTQLICQDELIQVVASSVSFSCVSLPVQAGLASVFPWLAQIAHLFQKWRIVSMKFYFKPTVSQYNALGQAGRLVLSFDTDAAGPLLTSLEEAEGMAPHADGMAYEKLVLDVPSRAKRQLFIRTGPQPAGTDVKTYDAGRLYISTSGMTAAAQIGELRCKYEVEVSQPMLPDQLRPSFNSTITKCSSPTAIIIVTATSQPINPTTVTDNGLDLIVDGEGVVMPSGYFRVTYVMEYTTPGSGATYFNSDLHLNGIAQAGFRTIQGFATGVGTQYHHISGVIKCNAGDHIQPVGYVAFSSSTFTLGVFMTISVA